MRRFLGRLRSGMKEEGGQALVLVASGMVALLAFAGLAIDVGQLRHAERQLQTAADAAALAGALEINQCGGTANCSAMQTAAQDALAENGLTGSTLYAQCASISGSAPSLYVMVNNGPCSLGSTKKDPNYGDANYVEAVVAEKVPTLFAGLIGVPSVNLSARAEATPGAGPGCLFVSAANPSSTSNQLLINGNATLDAHCGIMDDSDSNTALLVNGSDTVTATQILVHGGVLKNGSNTFSSSPIPHVSAQADPFSSLTPPTAGGCSYSNYTANGGTVTLNPGTYCGSTIFNSNTTVTFNPGMYIFEGTVIMNGGVNATGSGVTFYFSSGSLLMNGSCHASLVAPTTGTWAGILFYQNPGDSSQMILNGDTTSQYQGVLYVPDGTLLLNGGANLAAYTIVDAGSVTINGGVDFELGSDFSSLPGGSPVKGGTGAVLAE